MAPVTSHRPAGTPEAESRALERGILRAVAYADIFDQPLTGPEVHRYLVKERAHEAGIRGALRAMVPGRLGEESGHYFLPGRAGLVKRRRRREAAAALLWPVAREWARRIGALPFVRMVALTGSLTHDSANEKAPGSGLPNGGGDIDYLIVAEPARVWACRAFVGLLGRRARRRGVVLCANYVLSEDALALAERNVYTAHELARMVPLVGERVHRRLLTENPWAKEILPNWGWEESAAGAGAVSAPERSLPRSVAERVLRTPAGAWLDRAERARKLRVSLREGRDLGEARFDPGCFKGHFDGHGRRILAAYEERLRTLEAGGS